ncbi:unnamed protein product [Rhizophagus irregularis]|nr:unnamed protein product [Rhizophagus irregularis]
MQDSIRYSTVLTIIEISDHVEIGKLIGRNGRNLKPIEKGTDNEDRDENISTGERINKAICQIDKLLENIEIRNRRKDIEKRKTIVEFQIIMVIINTQQSQHQEIIKITIRKKKEKGPKEKCRIRPKLDK